MNSVGTMVIATGELHGAITTVISTAFTTTIIFISVNFLVAFQADIVDMIVINQCPAAAQNLDTVIADIIDVVVAYNHRIRLEVLTTTIIARRFKLTNTNAANMNRIGLIFIVRTRAVAVFTMIIIVNSFNTDISDMVVIDKDTMAAVIRWDIILISTGIISFNTSPSSLIFCNNFNAVIASRVNVVFDDIDIITEESAFVFAGTAFMVIADNNWFLALPVKRT